MPNFDRFAEIGAELSVIAFFFSFSLKEI